MKHGLSQREKDFVKFYMASANARQSAINAGYSHHSASVTGHRLLLKPKIAAFLKLQQEQQMSDGDITKVSVLTVLSDLIRDPKTAADIKLKALDQVNKIKGFYSRDIDLLLSMTEDQIKAVIERTKQTIETTYEHQITESRKDGPDNPGPKAIGGRD